MSLDGPLAQELVGKTGDQLALRAAPTDGWFWGSETGRSNAEGFPLHHVPSIATEPLETPLRNYKRHL